MFSDKIFIVHVYALEISCLCPYKESEISENDTSYFRLPQSLQSDALASKCQNIPQKSNSVTYFHRMKKNFGKKLQFRCQEQSLRLSLPFTKKYKIPKLDYFLFFEIKSSC